VIALIIFFSTLLYDYMRDPNVKYNDNSEMGDLSTGKSLKRAMKSFMVYVDQKEGSTSSPTPSVSEISLNQRNSPFSPPTFTSRFCVLDHEHVVDVSENATARALSVSAPETDPFITGTLSRRSFSVLDHEHVGDVAENATARASSVSAPDQTTEDILPNTPR
jgi:hypothetical protein